MPLDSRRLHSRARHLTFERVIVSNSVLESADSTKVTAEFRDGVLKVHLPTTPIARSKAIEVKVK
jgi:HSP20 family molecular chaperone IbpA